MATSVDERKRAEEVFRKKWVQKLVDLLREANAPIVLETLHSMDPESALSQCGGRKRGRTIRQYVREWGKARDWMILTKGYPFPKSAIDMVDYLSDAVDGRSSKTLPGVISSAFSSIEKAGGVKESARISKSAMWMNAIASKELDLDTDRGERKKAPSFLYVMVVSLELYVLNEGNPRFARAFAWVRLLKLWGSLRSDDLQGILPSTMIHYKDYFEAKVQRTKTTGPGKMTRWVNVVVDRSCTLAGQG